MSLQRSSSLDEFYGICCIPSENTNECDESLNYRTENFVNNSEKGSAESQKINSFACLENLKLGTSEVVEVSYEHTRPLDDSHCSISDHSEQCSSYYEELDFETSVTNTLESEMSHVLLDNEDIEFYSDNADSDNAPSLKSPENITTNTPDARMSQVLLDNQDIEFCPGNYSENAPSLKSPKNVTSDGPSKREIEISRKKVKTVNPKVKFTFRQQMKAKTAAPVRKANFLTQNVLTARKIKINDLHNEITDLQRQLKDMEQENKILKQINNRQQRELNKIEESRGVLPELIKAHGEEIRALKTLLKQSRDKTRELEQRMKTKDFELERRKQELQNIRYLSNNKELLERNELHKKNKSLGTVIKEKHQTIMDLNRKLELLEKCYKRDIIAEKNRQKEIMKGMHDLQMEYNKLQYSLTLKEKKIEQQNMYCNSRKPVANSSSLEYTISPKNKFLFQEDNSLRQAKAETFLHGGESFPPKYNYISDKKGFGWSTNSQFKLNEKSVPKLEQRIEKVISEHSPALKKSSSDVVSKFNSITSKDYESFETDFERLSIGELSRQLKISSLNECKLDDSLHVIESRSEKGMNLETKDQHSPRIKITGSKEGDSFPSKSQQLSPGCKNNPSVVKQISNGNEQFVIDAYVPSGRSDFIRQSSRRSFNTTALQNHGTFHSNSRNSLSSCNTEECNFSKNAFNNSQEALVDPKMK